MSEYMPPKTLEKVDEEVPEKLSVESQNTCHQINSTRDAR
jgi:hypothetical protein